MIADNYAEDLDSTKAIPYLKRINVVIVFLVILFISWPVVSNLILSTYGSTINSVSINNITLITPRQVCPGDNVIFSYSLDFRGSGSINKDLTLWRVSPPRTVVYSQRLYQILPGNTTQETVLEPYRIPYSFYNYETGKYEPIEPGIYHRLISVFSPQKENVADTSLVEIEVLPKEQCYGK